MLEPAEDLLRDPYEEGRLELASGVVLPNLEVGLGLDDPVPDETRAERRRLPADEGKSRQFAVPALLANPVEIARVLAIIHLEPDLEILGPFGTYLYDEVGTTNATLLLGAALAVWVAVPVWFAIEFFNKADS